MVGNKRTHTGYEERLFFEMPLEAEMLAGWMKRPRVEVEPQFSTIHLPLRANLEGLVVSRLTPRCQHLTLTCFILWACVILLRALTESFLKEEMNLFIFTSFLGPARHLAFLRVHKMLDASVNGWMNDVFRVFCMLNNRFSSSKCKI